MENFRPLVSIEKIRRARNHWTQSLRDEIDDAFRGYVLPGKEKGFTRFLSSEVPLYVPVRAWQDASNAYADKTNYRYEFLVNDFFWEDKDKKLLVLLGQRGIGKSTFIQHYLRCFCPEHAKTGHSFESKLVLYFDCKNCSSERLFVGFFLDYVNSQFEKYSIPVYKFENNDPIYSLIGAIRHFSTHRQNKHLIICFDNIDQCAYEIQRHAASIISQLIQNVEGIDIWKIVFPLWAETFNRLKSDNAAFNLRAASYREITLGYVDSRRMILKRVAKNLAENNGKPLRSYVYKISKPSYQILQNISYRDNKLLLKMIGDLLTSQRMEEYVKLFEKKNKNPIKKQKKQILRKYEFEDTLVCGQYTHHHNENIILNVFNILEKRSTNLHRDILMGSIFLEKLGKSGTSIHVDKLIGDLSCYGYGNDDIRKVLERFKTANFFHYEDISETRISIHVPVVEEYQCLVCAPAYIDNMALVTPLPPECRASMTDTVGYAEEDFKERVRSSIQFINFISLCEIHIHNMLKIEHSFSVDIAKEYYKRLKIIRYDKKYSIVPKSDPWWGEVLDANVFFNIKQ